VRKYCRHQSLAVTLAAVFGQNEDIDQVGESRGVGDDSRERHLPLADETTKAQGVINGRAHNFE
jgi:hypothetical protein